MDMLNRATRAASAPSPRIRIFHSHALFNRLQNLSPRTQYRASRQIANAAIAAMIGLKRGLEITYLAFEGAGCPLVLSSHWFEAGRTLTIEIDLRPARLPRIALVGPLPRPRMGKRD